MAALWAINAEGVSVVSDDSPGSSRRNARKRHQGQQAPHRQENATLAGVEEAGHGQVARRGSTRDRHLQAAPETAKRRESYDRRSSMNIIVSANIANVARDSTVLKNLKGPDTSSHAGTSTPNPQPKAHAASWSAGRKSIASELFKHKGVWVRPASVAEVVGPKHNERRPAPFEEHVGTIDDAAGVDLGHAILAFEFIDRINDEMLQTYLPEIDRSLGKKLGLQHDAARLATPRPSQLFVSRGSKPSGGINPETLLLLSDEHGQDIGRKQTNDVDADDQISDVDQHSQLALDTDLDDEEVASIAVSGNGCNIGHSQSSSCSPPACHANVPSFGEGDIGLHCGSTPDFQVPSRAESRLSRSRLSSRESHVPSRPGTSQTLHPTGHGVQQDERFSPSSLASLETWRATPPGIHCSENPRGAIDGVTPSTLEITASPKGRRGSALSTSPGATTATPAGGGCSALSFVAASGPEEEDDAAMTVKQLMPKQVSASCGSAVVNVASAMGVVQTDLSLDVDDSGLRVANRVNASSAAEAAVWPNASTLVPLGVAHSRSSKLRAVDSMPDAKQVLEPSNNIGCLRPHSQLEAVALALAKTKPGRIEVPSACMDPFDPASTVASMTTVYSAGAARVRRPRQYRLQPTPPHSEHGPRLRRPQHLARRARIASGIPSDAVEDGGSDAKFDAGRKSVGSRCTSTAACSNGPHLPPGRRGALLVQSPNVPQSGNSATGNADGIDESIATVTATGLVLPDEVRSYQTPSPGGRAAMAVAAAIAVTAAGAWGVSRSQRAAAAAAANERPQTGPPIAANMLPDNIDQTLMENCRHVENANCPFSREALDSASSVVLRCGHRFALHCMGVARQAARNCASAGLAQKDALICPLCGDQDDTSKPGAHHKLITYSANPGAYMMDLRKDWQLPLRVPAGVGAYVAEEKITVSTPQVLLSAR